MYNIISNLWIFNPFHRQIFAVIFHCEYILKCIVSYINFNKISCIRINQSYFGSTMTIHNFCSVLFFLISILYCYSITVVCLFSPSLHPTPGEPPSLPHLDSPPWFCPCVLYSSSCNPLSSLSPPHSPLTTVNCS